MATAEHIDRELAREQRALGVRIALYGIGVVSLATVIVSMLKHVVLPAMQGMQWSAALPPGVADVNSWAVPIAGLAVIASGAWLFARDRHLGVI